MFFTRTGAVLAFTKPDANGNADRVGGEQGGTRTNNIAGSLRMSHTQWTGDVMRLELEGARFAGQPSGENRLPAVANYFIGNDSAKWRRNVPTYGSVRYTGVYDGIDLVYHGDHRQLEYDFVVTPHADPGRIKLRLAGVAALRLTPEGDLRIVAGHGEIAIRKPAIYQESNGGRTPVQGSFLLAGRGTVQFRIGAYDRNRPLIIDPVLAYSTYLGGSTSDVANAVAVNSAGRAFVAGETCSADFPTTTSAYQKKLKSSGSCTAFVSKLDSEGTGLVYSTYLGGSGGDLASAIAIDSSGDAYVAGLTFSSDFPITSGAFQQQNKGVGNKTYNGFVAELNPQGSALVYSTYLGGSGNTDAYGYIQGDGVSAISLDSAGNTYVTGFTYSPDFPVTGGAFEPRNKALANAVWSGFVSKLNAQGTSLIYSTYLGGSGVCTTDQVYQTVTCVGDQANAVAVDASGNAYVAGSAASTDFPITNGSANPNNTANFSYCLESEGPYPYYCIPGDDNGYGTTSGYTSIFSPDGSELVFSSYLGGSGSCQVSSDCNDPLNACLQTLVGCYGDSASSIALGPSGAIYVAGQTSSTDFPVSSRAYQQKNSSGSSASNAFVTEYDPLGSGIHYSTYLGGSGSCNSSGACSGDQVNSIAVDSSGNAYVAGTTSSPDFPTYDGFQRANKSQGPLLSTSFISVLDATGATLDFSTLMGGSGSDIGNSLALTPGRNVFVAGGSSSTDFPVERGAFQTKNETPNLNGTAWVARLNLSGSAAPAHTAAVLRSNANPGPARGTVTFTASISVPNVLNLYPYGRVSFFVDGKPAGTAALNNSGQASFPASWPDLGKHSITAQYAGNAAYSASVSLPLIETIERAQAITFVQPASPVTFGAKPVTLRATASSGLPVSFSVASGPGSVSGRYGEILTFTDAGTVVVAADQSGSGAFAAAPKVLRTVIVRPLGTVAEPSIRPKTGTYEGTQTVTITDTTSGATIYYTTDGSTPSSASTRYTSPFKTSESMTVKAVAEKTGYADSAVATSIISIQ